MKQQEFFAKYAPYAIDTHVKYGVPASITLAQAALESGWGESSLTKNAFNFFGIKDHPNDEWHAENYTAYTKEWNGSAYYSLPQPFRKYKTPQGSFNDHALFLIKNKRYAGLFNDTNYVNWANELKQYGYATDPSYSSKLINMVKTYNLEAFDVKAEQKKKLK
ncbi:MAG: uncharacterized protein K0R26_1904 [Bacteroidota bacterium]|jgi:flagellum-specific peptidoglycan hydrolase FlgJ|nr:uncharacterized protein [Bacteroidota bacterium]